MTVVTIYTTSLLCLLFTGQGVPAVHAGCLSGRSTSAATRRPGLGSIERANGQRTVPQIFVGEVHVGGYTDLVALDREGKFQPLLAAS